MSTEYPKGGKLSYSLVADEKKEIAQKYGAVSASGDILHSLIILDPS